MMNPVKFSLLCMMKHKKMDLLKESSKEEIGLKEKVMRMGTVTQFTSDRVSSLQQHFL